jgi:purine-binding chemotaxis protein CheW
MTIEGRQTETRTYLLPLALDDAGDNVFCLFSQNQVVEILGLGPIQRIPFSPSYLKGVVNYFDQLLPVINLDELCNRKRTAAAGNEGYRQLMVVRTGAVDPVTGKPLKAVITSRTRVHMVKFADQILATSFVEQEPPASLKASGVLRGFFQRQANYVALLDLHRVVLGTLGDVAPTN